MGDEQQWTVTVTFTTEDRRTRADATLAGGPDELSGIGRARRNPDDPEVPAIGHEIARRGPSPTCRTTSSRRRPTASRAGRVGRPRSPNSWGGSPAYHVQVTRRAHHRVVAGA